MMEFPKPFEDFLLRYVKSTFYAGTKRATFIDRPFRDEDLRFFAKGVSKLSDLFTTERAEIDSTYLNVPELQAGYLLYFLPINFGKSRFVLQQIPEAFWRRESLRVMDLGAGPGSASLALLAACHEGGFTGSLEITLVDQNKNILGHAEKFLRAWLEIFSPKFTLRLRSIRSDLRRLRWQGPYDLLLCSHALNEWHGQGPLEKAGWLEDHLVEQLSPDGLAVILEPALKRPTRELMAMRDHLLAENNFTVLAPCLQQDRCPMLIATPQDWCHFYIEWVEPEFLKKLDQLVKNENRFLKVSYLILGPRSYWSKNIFRPSQQYRVVSNRMETRGKIEVVLCGRAGGIHLTRLDRDRSEVNVAFDEMRRGDVVAWTGAEGEAYAPSRSFRMGKKDGLTRP